jgi:hypothetical protein
MNDTSLVALETGLPVARELAEMLLIKNDLTNSLTSLTIWTENYSAKGDQDPRARAINGSLFRDGITQFVGCFDSKNDVPLVVETVFPDVEGIGPYFRWLRSLRNSYTAHRHGAARQCTVGAMVDPVSGKYLGHGVLFAVYTGPSQEGHKPLLALISRAIQYVDTRIAVLMEQFTTEAGAMAPVDLLKLRPAAVQAQAPDKMNKSRGDVMRGIARENGETDEQA